MIGQLVNWAKSSAACSVHRRFIAVSFSQFTQLPLKKFKILISHYLKAINSFKKGVTPAKLADMPTTKLLLQLTEKSCYNLSLLEQVKIKEKHWDIIEKINKKIENMDFHEYMKRRFAINGAPWYLHPFGISRNFALSIDDKKFRKKIIKNNTKIALQMINGLHLNEIISKL